jgi:DNA polymerase III subunit gamma/tau
MPTRTSADDIPPWLDAPPEDEYAPPAAPEVREPAAAFAAPAPALQASPAAPAFVPTPLGDRWNEVVAQFVQAGGIVAMARELALQAQCLAIDETATPQRWTLRVERETLRAQANRDKVQAALAALQQQPVQLEVEAGPVTDTPSLRANAERNRRQAEAEQIIHGDPVVQSLMAQFKTARIVPGSIRPL